MTDIAWIQGAQRLRDLLPGAAWPDAAALMERARRRHGLDDFGPEPVADALDRLLYAYHHEAALTLFGRLAVRWDVDRLLANLLILRDRERADPAILRRPVERPIFVLGLPRSGTSFLHALLAEDEDSLAPRCWQAIYPYPEHRASGRGAGPDQVDRQFRQFHRLAPRMKDLHPFEARSPQECTAFSAHSFRSLRFDGPHHIPSYRRWLEQAGHGEGYAVHRRLLQHLGPAEGARWVLKSPDHVFSLPALLRTYPDARIVVSHRDPLKVLPSVARLTQELRRPFSRRVDPLAIGRQVGGDWARGAGRLVEADREGVWAGAQVFHVHFKTLAAEPERTVERLYQAFGMTMGERYRTRLKALVARRPRGGYGANRYRFEDFGLDPRAERARHQGYMGHFGVEPEVAT